MNHQEHRRELSKREIKIMYTQARPNTGNSGKERKKKVHRKRIEERKRTQERRNQIITKKRYYYLTDTACNWFTWSRFTLHLVHFTNVARKTACGLTNREYFHR